MPPATTLKLAAWPTVTDWSTGWVRIVGATASAHRAGVTLQKMTSKMSPRKEQQRHTETRGTALSMAASSAPDILNALAGRLAQKVSGHSHEGSECSLVRMAAYHQVKCVKRDCTDSCSEFGSVLAHFTSTIDTLRGGTGTSNSLASTAAEPTSTGAIAAEACTCAAAL